MKTIFKDDYIKYNKKYINIYCDLSNGLTTTISGYLFVDFIDLNLYFKKFNEIKCLNILYKFKI